MNKPMDTNRIESLLEQSKHQPVKPSDAQKTRMLNQIMANAPKPSASPAPATPWFKKRWFVITMPVIGVGAMAALAFLLVNQPEATTQLAQSTNTQYDGTKSTNSPEPTANSPEPEVIPEVNEETPTDKPTTIATRGTNATTKVAKASTYHFTYADLPCECGGGGDFGPVQITNDNTYSKNVPVSQLSVLHVDPMNIYQARMVVDTMIGTYVRLDRYAQNYDNKGNATTEYATYATKNDPTWGTECFYQIAIGEENTSPCVSITNIDSEVHYTSSASSHITESTAIGWVARFLNVPVSSLLVERTRGTNTRTTTGDPITFVYISEVNKEVYGIPYHELIWTISLKDGFVELIQGTFPTAITQRETVDIISPSEAHDRLMEGLKNPVLENPNYNRVQVASGFHVNKLYEQTTTPHITITDMQLEYVTWNPNTIIPVYRAFTTIEESGEAFEYFIDATKQGDVFNRVSQN